MIYPLTKRGSLFIKEKLVTLPWVNTMDRFPFGSLPWVGKYHGKISIRIKQSPRKWYKRFDNYVMGLGFIRRETNHRVYFKLVGDHITHFALYVDNILLIGNDGEIV